MKKRLIVLTLCMCLIAGCKNQETGFGTPSTEGSQESLAMMQTSEAEGQREKRPEELIAPGVPEFQNCEYNPDTDEPYYLAKGRVACTEDGVYFFSTEGILKFWDYASNKVVPVCTKLNCSHEGSECDAYFDPFYNRTEQGIWYQQGYLYMLTTDETLSKYALQRFQLDGTGREEIATLFTLEGEEEGPGSVIFHRGYVYYTVSDATCQRPAVIYRCQLTPGSKPESYYTFPGERADIHRVHGYGDGLFFQVGYYLDAEKQEYIGSVCYIGEGQEPCLLLADFSYDYVVVGSELIYSTMEEIRAVDFVSGEERVLQSGLALCYLSYDGTNLWADNWIGTIFDENIKAGDRTIYRMNLDGTIVEEIKASRDHSNSCVFGDDRYLFMEWYNSDRGPVLKAYDKAAGGWIKLG